MYCVEFMFCSLSFDRFINQFSIQILTRKLTDFFTVYFILPCHTTNHSQLNHHFLTTNNSQIRANYRTYECTYLLHRLCEVPFINGAFGQQDARAKFEDVAR